MGHLSVLVLGQGFVGAPLAEFLDENPLLDLYIHMGRLNVIDEEYLGSFDIVINTAAKTSIDWCEKNKEETFDTNVVQALRIAKLTQGKHIFFSSGCIFQSATEEDINYENSIPNPQCFYTQTKLMAEQLIMEAKPNALVLRPRLLVSEKSHPRNTINKLLKYDKIVTTKESVTIMEDMFRKLPSLFKESGAFNIFNEGTISPSEMMDIFEHEHEQISKEALDLMTNGAARRVSTVLGSKRTDPMPDIRERLMQIKSQWKT